MVSERLVADGLHLMDEEPQNRKFAGGHAHIYAENSDQRRTISS
jgi:hypothetical protein